jgi:hypothetical protein
VGTKTEPKFEERTADNGAPYTEGFLICDAARQSGVRVADVNRDGKPDLVALTDRGMVYCWANTTNRLFPLFAPEQRLIDNSTVYSKLGVADWNNDGLEDVLIANYAGYVTLYLNEGTHAIPKFGSGTKLIADGKTLRGAGRCSPLVCDWDCDGRKDLVLGMGGDLRLPPDGQYFPYIINKQGDNSGFLFYKNVGTDAAPVLAYPKWIVCDLGGEKRIITTPVRPNLGSYVDWDKDGKKDFIICNFESDIRLYRNIGSGRAGEEPVFGWPAQGVVLVAPWGPQLISSVDAMDWDDDGDIDIITGQGHGGAAIRLYNHGFVEDNLNHTQPRVTVGRTEKRRPYDSR